MQKKLFLTITASLFIFLQFSTPIFADDSTSSASSDMENKIKTLVQENLSTTEAKLKEKVNLQTLVGYTGKITTIGSNNLTVDSDGLLLQVATTSKTQILKDSAVIKLSTLAIGDKIIVIGTSVKEDIIQSKKIVTVKEDTSDQVTTTAVVAKITTVDLKKKTITLNLNGTDQTLSLSKKSTVKLDTLEAGQTILGIIKQYQGKLSLSRAKSL